MKSKNFSSIILAGGESSRIGENKALLNVMEEPLIKIVKERLEKISNKTYIVTLNPEDYSFLDNVEFVKDNVEFVKDIYPEKKSILEAMYSGLKASTDEYNFICSCDLPYLNTNLVNYLYSLTPSFDAVIPIFNNDTKTLHAFYSKKCLDPMEKVLEKGNKKVSRIFRDLNIKYIPEKALIEEDDKLLSFFSVKTYLDYMLCKDS